MSVPHIAQGHVNGMAAIPAAVPGKPLEAAAPLVVEAPDAAKAAANVGQSIANPAAPLLAAQDNAALPVKVEARAPAGLAAAQQAATVIARNAAAAGKAISGHAGGDIYVPMDELCRNVLDGDTMAIEILVNLAAGDLDQGKEARAFLRTRVDDPRTDPGLRQRLIQTADAVKQLIDDAEHFRVTGVNVGSKWAVSDELVAIASLAEEFRASSVPALPAAAATVAPARPAAIERTQASAAFKDSEELRDQLRDGLDAVGLYGGSRKQNFVSNFGDLDGMLQANAGKRDFEKGLRRLPPEMQVLGRALRQLRIADSAHAQSPLFTGKESSNALGTFRREVRNLRALPAMLHQALVALARAPADGGQFGKHAVALDTATQAGLLRRAIGELRALRASTAHDYKLVRQIKAYEACLLDAVEALEDLTPVLRMVEASCKELGPQTAADVIGEHLSGTASRQDAANRGDVSLEGPGQGSLDDWRLKLNHALKDDPRRFKPNPSTRMRDVDVAQFASTLEPGARRTRVENLAMMDYSTLLDGNVSARGELGSVRAKFNADSGSAKVTWELLKPEPTRHDGSIKLRCRIEFEQGILDNPGARTKTPHKRAIWIDQEIGPDGVITKMTCALDRLHRTGKSVMY
jgi:hypothetical protein